jgi:hypothetical protein
VFNSTADDAGSGEPMTTLIDLLGYPAYFTFNRTRPASVRKDMHTGRVFCFQALVVKHWRA